MKRIGVAALVLQLSGLCAATCLAAEGGDAAPAPAPIPFAAEPAPLDLSSAAFPELPAGAVPELPARDFDAAPLTFGEPAGDGRRTLGRFPRNVGRGLVGVFSRDNAAAFLIGAGVAVAAHSFDGPVAGALEGRCLPCGRTGATFGGGGAMMPAVAALFVAGRFAPQGRFRAVTYDVAQAMVVNGVWTGLLKTSVHRTRPDGLDNLSLPSGHTSNAFAIATVTGRHYGWKAALPAYALASCVGLSRIERNRHHLSDVLAGAALGVVVGRTVTRVNGEPAPRRRTLALGPATDARGTGIGLGLSASW